MKSKVPNKPWKDVVSPQEAADVEARLKAYWESIYGPRQQIDFKAIARQIQNAPPEPMLDCQRCNDLGLIRYDVAIEDALFGKMFACPDCAKGEQVLRDQWRNKYKAAELPRQFQGFTFESWDSTIHEESKVGKYPAYSAAKQFVTNDEHRVDLEAIYAEYNVPWEEWRDRRPKNSLVFYGDFGTGKSGLMAAAVNELMARGEVCLYVRVHDLIEEYQDTYREDADHTTREVLMKYKTVPVLFVDEFNIHKTSADKLDKIEQIIRYRYNNMLPTLMTMNIDQAEFSHMWSDRSGVAAVAMAHWIKLEGAVLRNADPPVSEEQWWQKL